MNVGTPCPQRFCVRVDGPGELVRLKQVLMSLSVTVFNVAKIVDHYGVYESVYGEKIMS